MDVSQYRRSTNGELRPAKSNRLPRHKAGEWFVKGPIPGEWLSQAAELPGKALHVGLAIWYAAGLAKQRRVRVTQKLLARFGIERRHTGYRGLRRLEAAGLIAVEHKRGSCPVVTIQTAPNAAAT